MITKNNVNSINDEVNKKLILWSKTFSVAIYFASIFFIVSWAIAFPREYIAVSNSSIYSRIFFFINPQLLWRFLFSGNAISYVENAVNLNSFMFALAYYAAIFSFFFVYICSCALFIISYLTRIKYFQYIACFGSIPIIGTLFNTYFIISLFLYNRAMSKGKNTSFKKSFTPDYLIVKEDEDLELIDRNDPFFQYSYKHYKKMYLSEQEEENILKLLHLWVLDKLGLNKN